MAVAGRWLQTFFNELRRRRVFRVAGFYLVVGWLLIQVATSTFPYLALPDWTITLVIVLVVLGLPVALVLAWLFDATASGIERTPPQADVAGEGSTAAAPWPPPEWSAAPDEGGHSPGLRRAAVAAVLVLVAVGAWGAWVRFFRPAPISGQALAVLPFSVQGGGDVKFLGEGLVDIVSRDLDGAGGMRALHPAVVLREAQKVAGDEPIDPDMARRIAARAGAGLYLLGSVQEAAGKLRIDAGIYQSADTSGAGLASATVDGDTAHVFALVDALAARLMANLEHGVSGRLAQTAAVTSRSLPALRAYLEGEHALRAAEFDTAIARFQSAVAEDSTFSLAYYRLGVAAWWGFRDAIVPGAIDDALRYSDRLDDRDRQLVEAAHDMIEGRADDAERKYRSILAEYPGDLDAQFQLATLLLTYNPMRGRPVEEARAPFDDVLAADPKFICPI